MSFFYKQTIKNSFEHKILNKIKKQLEKLNINVKEKIYIGFSFGDYHGTNIYYSIKKNEKKARLLKNILTNNHVDIACFSNMNMDYDIKILLGYSSNKDERKYIKSIVNPIIHALNKTYLIFENGIYLNFIK